MKPEPNEFDPTTEPLDAHQDAAQSEASLEAQMQDALDDGLLGEALGEPTPSSLESLERDIIALTDPQTLSLLDEALGANAPAQLAERIIAATTPGQGVADTADNDQPAVIGRITPNTWRYAAAAAITLAACVGIWFISQPGDTTPNPIANNNNGNTTLPEIVEDNENIDLEQFDFDEETALFAEFASDTQPLSDGLEEDAIDRDTIWSDMDAYEQFLSDIESDLG